MADARSGTVTVTRTIGAPGAVVWSMITDLPRMGEWSPESAGGSWVGGGARASVGARFRGRNHHGRRSWSTVATVDQMEAPWRFSFDVHAMGMAVSHWDYTIEPAEGGCVVTERWTDRRGFLLRALGGPVTGVGDRSEHNRATMEETLARLGAAAEAEPSRDGVESPEGGEP